VIAGLRIVERPIPTYYGDEISRVNGLRYAWNVTRAVIKARVQRLGIFYDRRFDCAPDAGQERYPPKLDFASPQAFALDMIEPGSRVLDLGCAGGHLGHRLRQVKRCRVDGIDLAPLSEGAMLDSFRQHDLDSGLPDLGQQVYDYVLLLDVIEHLSNPERFVTQLYERLADSPHTRVLVSTGNIGFVLIRMMLMLGQFNYGKRGILDLTHTRLFTFSSLRRLFEQCRFHIVQTRGVAAPFPLLSGSLTLRVLMRLNMLLVRVSKRLFAYQIFIAVRPYPALDYLLRNAERSSALRAEQSGR
jgi:2-polyprenyl-3-methyl-5-hydroxy-6-metoxy-1,4-benzoquinol methylase